MTSWDKLYHIVSLFGWPYAIAAAFHYTAWLGWPTLVIGGMFWVGTLLLIAEYPKKG